jgi:hypothetical protein
MSTMQNKALKDFFIAEQMNAMEIWQTLQAMDVCTDEMRANVIQLFKSEMANAEFLAHYNDIVLYDLTIYESMFNFIHKMYAEMLKENEMNAKNAFDQLVNWFMSELKVYIGLFITHSSAVYVLKNLVNGDMYKRPHIFMFKSETNEQTMFTFEVTCK